MPRAARRPGGRALRGSLSSTPVSHSVLLFFFPAGRKSGGLAAPALVFQPPKAAICSAADLPLVVLPAGISGS